MPEATYRQAVLDAHGVTNLYNFLFCLHILGEELILESKHVILRPDN